MGENSKIEWTHHTANLWHGCSKVNAGCDNCYAETLSHRWGRDIWGPDKPRLIIKSVWGDLAKYQKAAAAVGEIHRVFVGSMMDIFEKPAVQLIGSDSKEVVALTTSDLRSKLFEEISIGLYPNLLFLFLTKRPSNINKYIPESWKVSPPKNVIFGCSVSDQKTADTLIPQLLEVKGKHFLSIEPLLGCIDLSNTIVKVYGPSGLVHYTRPIGDGLVKSAKLLPGYPVSTIDWVIVGGESGHHARPMHPDWVTYIQKQCGEFEIPFLFKQWGEWHPYVENMEELFGHDYSLLRNHMFQPNLHAYRVGKKAAGRELNGRVYDEFPKL